MKFMARSLLLLTLGILSCEARTFQVKCESEDENAIEIFNGIKITPSKEDFGDSGKKMSLTPSEEERLKAMIRNALPFQNGYSFDFKDSVDDLFGQTGGSSDAPIEIRINVSQLKKMQRVDIVKGKAKDISTSVSDNEEPWKAFSEALEENDEDLNMLQNALTAMQEIEDVEDVKTCLKSTTYVDFSYNVDQGRCGYDHCSFSLEDFVLNGATQVRDAWAAKEGSEGSLQMKLGVEKPRGAGWHSRSNPDHIFRMMFMLSGVITGMVVGSVVLALLCCRITSQPEADEEEPGDEDETPDGPIPMGVLAMAERLQDVHPNAVGGNAEVAAAVEADAEDEAAPPPHDDDDDEEGGPPADPDHAEGPQAAAQRAREWVLGRAKEEEVEA